MDTVNSYKVNEYFNGQLIKTHSFDSYTKAFDFWHEMHRKTKKHILYSLHACSRKHILRLIW